MKNLRIEDVAAVAGGFIEITPDFRSYVEQNRGDMERALQYWYDRYLNERMVKEQSAAV